MSGDAKSAVAVLETCLGQMRSGDAAATERLLEHAYGRLQRMARRMIRHCSDVRRWEDTDDVWQAAAIRFYRALCKTPPESLDHFFRLAGTQIRRTLIDLARKHTGPLGLATNHDTNPGELPTPDPTNDPVKLADWTEFHQQVEQLPEELRQVFDLFWYGGLNTSEVAEQLRVSVRTVKRRWRDARLLLAEMRAGYAAGQLGNH